MGLRPNERLWVGENAHAAAEKAAEVTVAALAGRSRPVSVALAGGSTPALLYATLARSPYRERLPVGDICWFWADERAVPPDHAESNYRMTAEHLLEPLGVPAEQIRRMPAEQRDLDAAARQYEVTIREMLAQGSAGIPAFDLILLGVGPDGHTASLFPGSAALAETRRLVVANYAPSQKAWRMTMTYPLLMAAREILFFVTGGGKAEIMARMLSDQPGDLPAAALRSAPGRVTWVLDAEAARLVPEPVKP
jgi:6-phosphogluconolactonase